MSRRGVTVALLLGGVVVLAAIGVLVAGALGGGSDAARGSLSSALADAVPARAPFADLTEVQVAIGDSRCLRLAVADSLDERVAGLRDHSADLGPYDGMLFVFDGPTSTAFTMSGVDSGLEIAFFDGAGRRTTSLSMTPCPDKAEKECPVYRSDAPYVYAVETRPGGLPAGSLGACPAT
jgi:uncharacterized membrane protein (UPF0127 family)